MPTVTEHTGYTGSGSTTLDPADEVQWRLASVMFKCTPDVFLPFTLSTLYYGSVLRAEAWWTVDGTKTGSELFSTSAPVFVDAMLGLSGDTGKITRWSGNNTTGIWWAQEDSIGATSGTKYHKALWVETSRNTVWVSRVCVAGGFGDAGFEFVKDKVVCLNAVGLAA